jgi:chromosome segregation ATPase
LRIKLKEQVTFLAKQIETTELAITATEKETKAHKKVIASLEQDLKNVQRELAEAQHSAEQSKELELKAAQVTRYKELKEEARLKTAPLRGQLEKLQSAFQSFQEAQTASRTDVDVLRARQQEEELSKADLEAKLNKIAGVVNQTDEEKKTEEKQLSALVQQYETAEYNILLIPSISIND